MNIFWVMKILWIIFLGHHKFRGHFFAFLFLRSRYRMGDIFWVAKI